MKESLFDQSVTALGSLLKLAAAAALLAIMVLTCLDVSMRYFFSRPIPGTYDAVSLLGAILVSSAMPYTMLQKGHVAVDILLQSLPKRTQRVIDTLTHVVGILLFVVLVRESIALASDMKAAGEVMPTLLVPFYPILYAMAGCFLALCLAIIVNLRRIWIKDRIL